jgi:DNA-directed RNA polymerase subunit RPC12/RpoP
MSEIPSIDYSCARCGARHIYQLVAAHERPTEEQANTAPHPTPSLDFTCSRCGTSHTYTLMPVPPAT